MFNTTFAAKSGQEFFGRVVEQDGGFQAQIFNQENEGIFVSTFVEKPEQADQRMKFHFDTIKNDQ